MKTRTVGQIYDESMPFEGDDGLIMDFAGADPALLYFSNKCSEKVLNALKNNVIMGYLISLKGAIHIMLEIKGLGHMDCAFHIQENLEGRRFVDPPEDTGYTATYYIINSITGILEAVRLLHFGKHFSKVLYKEIQEQLTVEHDHYTYLKNIKMISNYSDSELKKRSLAQFKDSDATLLTHVIEDADIDENINAIVDEVEKIRESVAG
jgi:hypothetical protein